MGFQFTYENLFCDLTIYSRIFPAFFQIPIETIRIVIGRIFMNFPKSCTYFTNYSLYLFPQIYHQFYIFMLHSHHLYQHIVFIRATSATLMGLYTADIQKNILLTDEIAYKCYEIISGVVFRMWRCVIWLFGN